MATAQTIFPFPPRREESMLERRGEEATPPQRYPKEIFFFHSVFLLCPARRSSPGDQRSMKDILTLSLPPPYLCVFSRPWFRDLLVFLHSPGEAPFFQRSMQTSPSLCAPFDDHPFLTIVLTPTFKEPFTRKKISPFFFREVSRISLPFPRWICPLVLVEDGFSPYGDVDSLSRLRSSSDFSSGGADVLI